MPEHVVNHIRHIETLITEGILKIRNGNDAFVKGDQIEIYLDRTTLTYLRMSANSLSRMDWNIQGDKRYLGCKVFVLESDPQRTENPFVRVYKR